MNTLKTILVAVVLSACSCLYAQQTDSIRHVLDSAYSKTPFCANILLVKDGKTLLERSYGYADAAKGIPLASHNSFQVASISKQFTAYGIMQLANRKLLTYDDPVNKYIPSFPYPEITVRHLLNHTSGLPDFWNLIRPTFDTTRSNGNKEMLQYLAGHKPPLQWEPGSRFAYTDIGYDLLAMVIENVSGKSYEQYMADNIFRPLKMKDTRACMVTDYRRIQNKHLAPGHVFDTVSRTFKYAHLQPQYNTVFYLGDFYGDGSVVTTARDLAKWDKALKTCKLLPCNIQQEAFTGPVYNGKAVLVREETVYGFGWFIRPGMIYHSGRHAGNIHGIYRYPKRGLLLILLSNSETPDFVRLRGRMLSLMND